MKLQDLKPAPYNPREIDASALKALGKSMSGFGDIAGITWNERTGHLVAGHQRVKKLRALGAVFSDNPPRFEYNGDTFLVRTVDWSEDKEKAANVSANNHLLSGSFDTNLAGVLGDIKEAFSDELFTGLRFDVLGDKFPADHEDTDVTQDEVPDKPKVPVTKPGDLWLLGDHRVRCGDCRDVAWPKPAQLVWTDPPYGIDYVGGTAEKLTIQNDGADGLAALLEAAFATCLHNCAAGAPWYVCSPPGPDHLEFGKQLGAIGVHRQTLVWAKNSLVLGRSHFHYKHELIFYGWKPGASCLHPPPDRKQDSVWAFDRPSASKEHPTMKPVALVAHAIELSSDPGDLVLDPFMGSGTTLIASEQLGRASCGTELDPAYCDVIIERWERLTGDKAKRIPNG